MRLCAVVQDFEQSSKIRQPYARHSVTGSCLEIFITPLVTSASPSIQVEQPDGASCWSWNHLQTALRANNDFSATFGLQRADGAIEISQRSLRAVFSSVSL